MEVRGVAEVGRAIDQYASVVEPPAVTRLAHVAGRAARDASLAEAADDLGPDRAMSGFRRTVQLRAGYDLADARRIQLNLRPAGAWVLADRGRKGTTRVYPRVNGRKRGKATPGRAVLTPMGPRAWTTSRPSRGLRTLTDATRRSRRDVIVKVHGQLGAELRRVIGRT